MTTFAHVFSLALLHFLWQGTAGAILLDIALFAMRKRSANARYLVSCFALAVLMLLPAATAYLLYERPAMVAGVELPSAAELTSASATAQTADWLKPVQNFFQVWSVPAWCFGVLFFSVRLVWGSRQVSLMRRRGEPAEETLRALVAGIARRMGVNRRVSVLISAMADGPSVIGLFRPVILLPAATILGLAPEQLEAVLAHELAHIRRYDYLVNMMQVLAEALLFYHPAVWWTSARIRRERELCCDDEAVRACGDAFRYARALAALERIRVMTPSLALGGTDGPLAYRISRLISAEPQGYLPSKLPGMMAVCLALACLAVSVSRVRAQAVDAPGVRVDLGTSTVIHRAPVEYPAAARIVNIKGMVSVELHLDGSGNVSDARVLSGPEELRKPVLQSVLGWHFTPDAAGGTRVVNVEFQAPAQEKPRAVVVAPDTHEVDRTATTQLLREQRDQAKADLAEARALDRDSGAIAREAKARALLAELELRLRDAEERKSVILDTRPTRPEPLVLPTFFAKNFTGRTLRSIRLDGIGMSTEDFIARTQMPVGVGDTLTQSSMEATVAAVKKFDDHLSERWTPVESNGIELTIFAPGAPMARGGGVGAGVGAGIGVGAGDFNAGTSAPAVIYKYDPEYTDEASAAKWQGTVVLSVIVDETGKPTDIKVRKPLGMGLDEKAVEAVQKWLFKPGMKDGKPVPVAANIEVNFRLP